MVSIIFGNGTFTHKCLLFSTFVFYYKQYIRHKNIRKLRGLPSINAKRLSTVNFVRKVTQPRPSNGVEASRSDIKMLYALAARAVIVARDGPIKVFQFNFMPQFQQCINNICARMHVVTGRDRLTYNRERDRRHVWNLESK